MFNIVTYPMFYVLPLLVDNFTRFTIITNKEKM